jgi:hypothetical protein
MPLPEKFFNMDGEEVSLEELCDQEPLWAAIRIRGMFEEIDALSNKIDELTSKINSESGRIVSYDLKYDMCTTCGSLHKKKTLKEEKHEWRNSR